MRFSSVFVLGMLFLSSLHFAEFAYLGSMNGTNPYDPDYFYKFSQPAGLLFVEGRLYIADAARNALYIMNASDLNASTRKRVLLSSASTSPFDNPLRMAYDSGVLYIADGIGTTVKTYSGEGFQTTDWNKKESSNMAKPSGVALDNQSLFITDIVKGRLFIYSRATHTYARIGLERGPSDGELEAPADIKIYGDKFFISDSSKGVLFAYDRNLSFLYTIGRGMGGVTLSSPRGFEIYEDMIYVADTTNNRVVVFTMDGYPVEVLNSTSPGGSFSYPEDLAIGDGKLYVADTLNKLVKVFEIRQASGNDTVIQLISEANASVLRLLALQQVASRLNVTFNQSDAASSLVAAQTDYAAFMFSSASNLARKALDSSASSQEAVSQDIDLKIRRMMKAEQDKVEPYREGATNELSAKLVRFDNTASDIKAKLSARSFSSAADAVLSLPQLADAFVLGVQGKKQQEKEKQQNRTAEQFGLQVNSLAARMERLKGASETYRQGLNLSNAEDLLAAAKSSASEDDYDSANKSLSLADFEISSYETTMGQAANDIEAALANVSVIEFGMSASAAKSMLIPPDLSGERTQVAQARETAYTNPQLAVAMAQRAADSASVKVRDASALSTAAAALVAMLVAIGIVSAVFYMHLRRRKRMRREERQAGHREGHKASEQPKTERHQPPQPEKPAKPKQQIWKE